MLSHICIIIIILIIIYSLIIQFRYKLYFLPNKIIPYTPKEFNLEFEDIYIGKLNGWLIYNPKLNKQTNEKSTKKSNKLIIYFSGNTGNISNRIHIIQKIFDFFDDTDIFVFDYPSFGLSNGKLNPSYIISSCHKIYDFWTNKYKQIGLLGESIGSGIMADTYDMITKTQNIQPFVIIHLNGITSIKEIADTVIPPIIKPFILPWITEFNTEKNYLKHFNKLPKLIIIHANNDEIVPINYVENMIKNLNKIEKINFFKIDGSHNDPIFDTNIENKIKETYNSINLIQSNDQSKG